MAELLEQLYELENDSDLTSTEKVVLTLICKEKTSTEIAEILNCSLKTVETHRKNLFQKTNSKNVVGLVKYALKNKIDIH
jgi:DNA-binding CsgD family transcriptional regulator